MKNLKTFSFVTKTPLAAVMAMTVLLSALLYAACDVKKAKDSDRNDKLTLAAFFILGRVNPHPVTEGNIFSIQYRNSTSAAVAVWLMGSQPPCSQAEALQCDSEPGGVPWNSSAYEAHWKTLREAGVFTRSGTHFYNISGAGVSTEVNVSNRTVLQPGETLRIVPPIVNGKPQWYWAAKGGLATAGVKGWVTRAKDANGADISMPASMGTLLFEYNLDQGGSLVWMDISAVDGINANATMTYEGASCDSAVPKVVKTNIEAYSVSNTGGCPYVRQFESANTCPNPKLYPAAIDASAQKASWVVGTDHFTNASVESGYPEIWTAAQSTVVGPLNGLKMATAAVPGEKTPAELAETIKLKKAYHIWWSTNPVAQGWLNYLQKNASGTCDAYGWAFDEKKWKPGDSFDESTGNPPDNPLRTLVKCSMSSNTYLNIDILKVM